MRFFRENLNHIFDLESSGRLLLYSALVGVVAGLGAAVFSESLDAAQQYLLKEVNEYDPPGAGTERYEHPVRLPGHWWTVILVPTLGGLACGAIVYGLAPEAEGHGTDAVVGAFHRLQGSIRTRVPLVKGVASIITIATGGSAGREGPIAQVGAGFGSFLGRRLKLHPSERRILVLAGAGGGVGAIFGAPLGGALFAVEVLYASTAIEFGAIVPCVVASVVAYSVFTVIFGQGFVFTPPEGLAFQGAHELPFYLLFAVLCSLVGFLYVWVFYGSRDHVFRRLPVPNFVKPAIGGFILGIIAIWLPHVMAGGYGWIQEAMYGNISWQLMAVLVVAKILATSATISSGGSGGVFAPSLFIGAMLGGSYGIACNTLFPDIITQPEAFVLVGMGGFFAGVAKVPLTSLLMVSEMSGSYKLIVPLMLVSMINVALLSRRWTLYEEQVASLIHSPAHLGEFVVDVLEELRVSDVYDPRRPVVTIAESMPLPAVLEKVAHSTEAYFPVVDNEGRLTGIFSLGDIRATLVGNGAADLIVAADLANPKVATVSPGDTLLTALRVFAQHRVDELPVLDPARPGRVMSMLRRGEVIAAYDREMARIRGRKAAHTEPAAALAARDEPVG